MSKFPDNIFDIVSEDLVAVEEELYSIIQSPVDMVNDIGVHLVQAGGKRIRPALYLLCARGGVPNQAELLPMAVAIELIHMATLVHDDIIDNAATRRGRPTANARWGNHSSVLTGDYLFAKAFSAIILARKNMLKILTDVICNICEGEIIQLKEAFNANQTEADYRLRVAQKTADFIAASCELGAIAGGLDEKSVIRVREYGYALGMAFQITDDILDITASAEQLGKPVGNDLRQGIVTLPVIYALKNSPRSDELRNIIINQKMSDDEVKRGLEIIHQTEAVEYSYGQVHTYLQHARNSLPATLNSSVRESLFAVADFVGLRKY
ncbi:polyprenyl synthetase family protein [Sporomusa sphaeroides]|uniref:Heptaprenyl diphosphate synthase component 2 n=2 Tax=Sporomusa TaxID=2375 RepID=A0ABM9W914_9FIRM|nr:heptaprenyl diphosphate synthase component 2 [Sporomusa sphaeroides DSM 2875]CVK20974.1 Heptaprenyl diphosphate synthase component 2 [Sporomusa sphaeroides DSM 2875]SCM80813.1 Heptaprenyl diphosphate synthase component 2 [uncultured Sporomusa sp.]